MATEKRFKINEAADGTSLTVDFVTNDSAIVQEVIDTIQANSKFRTLVLACADLSFENISRILSSTKNLRNLKALTLRGTHALSASEVVTCVEMICGDVETINLAVRSIDNYSALKIAQLIYTSKVTKLTLTTRKVDITGAISLIDLLKNSTLKILGLYHIRLEEQDADAMLHYLKSNSICFELKLSNTEFTKKAKLLVCELLQEKKLGHKYIPHKTVATTSDPVNPYKLLPSNAQAVRQLQEMGNGLLWKIPYGQKPSYIFGTIHRNDDQAIAIAKNLTPYVKNSAIALVEGNFKDYPCLTMCFPLDELLSSNDYNKLISIFSSKNMILAEVFCQPWLAQLSVTSSNKSTRKIIDQEVIQAALDSNIEVVNLETVDDQVRVLGGHNAITDQIEQLLLSLAHHEELGQITELMAAQYLQFDLIGLLTTFYTPPKFLLKNPEQLQLHQQHIKELIDDRDASMVAKIMPYIREGGALVSVGASHLLGILLALKNAGLPVSCVDEFAHQPANKSTPTVTNEVIPQGLLPPDEDLHKDKSFSP